MVTEIITVGGFKAWRQQPQDRQGNHINIEVR